MNVESGKGYFKDAQSWAADRQATAFRSRRIAWTVASAATVVAVLEALALVLLMPLKTVVPLTLLVDRQTGYVQALDPVTPRRMAADQALTQSFLVQYVLARESFDRATMQPDFRKVALWSTGSARASYLASMSASNPAGRLAQYGPKTSVSSWVKSVSLVSPNMALVRFGTRSSNGGQTALASAWVALIRFRYSDAPMQLADRFTNPLGFQVLTYRRDAEALPAAQESAPLSAKALLFRSDQDDAGTQAIGASEGRDR